MLLSVRKSANHLSHDITCNRYYILLINSNLKNPNLIFLMPIVKSSNVNKTEHFKMTITRLKWIEKSIMALHDH